MRLPIEEIVAVSESSTLPLEVIGHSRSGLEIGALQLGSGDIDLSLIAGCHADEPVGPAMLGKLAHYLSSLPASHKLLESITWSIVPHVNPDGAEANAGWTSSIHKTTDSKGQPDQTYDPIDYVRSVVREAPGDDIEFGFPHDKDDLEARPENRAVARFLASRAPFDLHASFHGMGFAPGPWFLIEPAWIDRTANLRDRLRARVAAMGLTPLDIDRKGEKGFKRIDKGFSTRPDSTAMVRHFQRLGQPEIAAHFRPSSMEHVRALGGDPFTFVSEMPLFLLPPPGHSSSLPSFEAGTSGMRQIHDWFHRNLTAHGQREAVEAVRRSGVEAMPIRDQMRLQLEFLDAAIETVTSNSTQGRAR